MPTQYTPILKLALPVTGELNGTWGDVANENITSMIEEAIAGLATISTWTSNSHTLTTADGTTDEARCAMLVATSTTAASEIICPALSKLYVLKNDSSYTVTLKTSAGTGTAVAAGETAFLFCDGTNVEACVTQIVNGHITGNLVVDGTTTLNDTATTETILPAADNTYDLGSSGASWRNLYIDGTATIASLVATTADINGGTIDGATVGATSASTGRFTQVNITGQGDLRLEDTTGGEYVALQAPGTLAASYTLTMPADDGTSGQALITDGSGNLSWSTAASGDVYGPASATDNAVSRFDGTTGKLIQNSGVIIDDSNNVTGVAALTASGDVTLSGGTANGVVYANGSKVLTSGSALTFDGTSLNVGLSGNAVQVGSASTAETSISVKRGSDVIYLGGDTTSHYLYGSGTLPISFWVNSTERMRLTSTGLGIGTSSPQTKLHIAVGTSAVTETIRLDNTGNYSDNGNKISWFNAAQSPEAANISAFRIGSSTGYGLSFATSSNFSTTNAVERMRLDSSGNLGLGVTPSAWSTPFRAFQGSDSCAIGFQTNAAVMRLMGNNYYNGTNYVYKSSSAASQFNIKETGAFEWQQAPSGTAGSAISFTQAMTLDASGNLGLGTASPISAAGYIQQTINGASGSYINLRTNGTTGLSLGSDGNNGYITGPTGAYALIFQNAGSERMRIDSSGNVGIGTSSPANKLDVASSTGGAIGFKYIGNSAYASIKTDGNNTLIFGTDGNPPTERMRIDSSGNLLVGTTTTNPSAVNGVQISGDGNTVFSRSGTGPQYQIQFNNGNGNVGRIETNGSSTSYVTSSDYRLKENIQPMQGALGVVAQLNPVTYTWKADGSDGQGFIAHELQAVVPDCVTGEKDAVDEEGKPVYQGIDTSFLVATLTKALQEAHGLIKDLEARVAVLEAK